MKKKNEKKKETNNTKISTPVILHSRSNIKLLLENQTNNNNNNLLKKEIFIKEEYKNNSIPMIFSNMEFNKIEEIIPILNEYSTADYTVIGVIGTQGVGKSTILNLLVNNNENKPFNIQTLQNKLYNTHQTEGIHLFITNEKLILLDVQVI